MCVGNYCGAADVLELVRISEAFRCKCCSHSSPRAGLESKGLHCLHDMRAKVAPLIFGSCLGGLILTGSFFLSFIFQREIIKLLLA